MENEDINQLILDLWEKYSKENHPGTKRWPLFYPEFPEKCEILFVGINPSFREDMNKIQDYNFSNKEFSIQDAIYFEKNAKDKNSKKPYKLYFGPVWDIVEGCNLKDRWDHIDLFLIRNKTQKIVEELVKGEGTMLFNDFGSKQINIFLKIIEKINPKVIFVVNKFASEIVEKNNNFKIDKSRFEKEGFYRIFVRENSIPLFFSGYLGSGRLDIYSKKRLIWHIKQALNGGCR